MDYRDFLMIIYGGTKEIVEKQLACEHNWTDVCIDEIGRYNKCTICFCLVRDFISWEQYLRERQCIRENIEEGLLEIPYEVKEALAQIACAECALDAGDLGSTKAALEKARRELAYLFRENP